MKLEDLNQQLRGMSSYDPREEQATIYSLWAQLAESRAEVARLEQTSGDLCDSCGWRTVIAGTCAKCAGERAEAKLARCVEALKDIGTTDGDCVCDSGYSVGYVARAALAAARGE